jgi:hypothetical protein
MATRELPLLETLNGITVTTFGLTSAVVDDVASADKIRALFMPSSKAFAGKENATSKSGPANKSK